jgi:hypothetical protein
MRHTTGRSRPLRPDFAFVATPIRTRSKGAPVQRERTALFVDGATGCLQLGFVGALTWQDKSAATRTAAVFIAMMTANILMPIGKIDKRVKNNVW